MTCRRILPNRPLRCILPVAALLLTLGAAGPGAASRESWRVAPPASWVQEAALPSLDGRGKGSTDAGLHYLLVDRQVRGIAEAVDYRRRAWTPRSTAAVQQAREIQISFDPSYQRLVIHHVRLLRDGRDRYGFSPADVRVIQQEAELDEQIYSGELTAVIFLRDLRPGDIVDYAYSLEGSNPIIGQGFDEELPLAYDSPVKLLRHVVHVPAASSAKVTALNTTLPPGERTAEGWHTYTWQARDVPALLIDDEQPGWFDPTPRVLVSTFQSWEAVGRWARGLFEQQLRPSPEIAALAAQFSAKGNKQEAAAAAVRFVQDEVRYLGIEMGPSSHQPHPPDQVYRQRFGDCKDKSLLLVALLREMGHEAAPALVNTELGKGLDQEPPSAFAFDHAIVRAVIDGREIWIDATESGKGGSLEDRDPPALERALVLTPTVTGLSTIPLAVPPEPTIELTERYTLGRSGAPVRLDVTTIYRRGEADYMRERLATTSSEELAKSYLDYYARDNDDIKAIATPAARDDREHNVVTVTEAYELTTFWEDGAHELYGAQVRDSLPKSVPSTRATPLAVPHPVHVAHHVVVRAPEPFSLGSLDEAIEDHAFAFRSRLQVKGSEMRLSFEYRSKADSVPVEKLKGHQAAVDRVRHALSFTVRSDLTSPDAPARGGWMALVPTAVLVTAILILWMWLPRRGAVRRRAAFDKASRGTPGATAATAIRAESDTSFFRQCSSRFCQCGGRTGMTVIDRTLATYDGHRLTVLRLRCKTCGVEQDVYGDVRDTADAAGAPIA